MIRDLSEEKQMIELKVGDKVVSKIIPELGIGTISKIDLKNDEGVYYTTVTNYGVTTCEVKFGDDIYIFWTNKLELTK